MAQGKSATKQKIRPTEASLTSLKQFYDKMKKEVGMQSLSDTMGIPHDTLENLYTMAYTSYNQGKYEEASKFFGLLVMMDVSCYKYVLGLAASQHFNRQYEEAASNYLMASLLEPKDPTPHYYAAECYLELGDTVSALVFLKRTLEVAQGQPAYASLKERAQLAWDHLSKEVKGKKNK